MKFDEVAISGTNGLLGRKFAELLPAWIKAKYIPLRRHEAQFENLNIQPGSLVIHCAAETNVERCELDPIHCMRSNLSLTQSLVNYCRDISDLTFVYISSTGVYGTQDRENENCEQSPVYPTTTHHFCKFLSEQVVQSEIKNNLIIRTGWLFGRPKTDQLSFTTKILSSCARTSEDFIYSDPGQIGSPTFVDDLVSRCASLLKNKERGIFNVVNSGRATRMDYVKEIVKQSKFSGSLNVKSAPEGWFDRTARVAPNETAISNRSRTLGYPEMRHWKDAIKIAMGDEN